MNSTIELVTSVITTDSTFVNESREDLVSEDVMARLKQKMSIRAIDEQSLVCLLVAYSILITTGAIGNGLVCLAVARKPTMRTARNIYIINLAISDLLLCLFTMPFTLVEIVLRFWPLGMMTCRLVAGLEATSIFVSTISIMAIAIDRYKVIVHPTREQFNPLRGFLMIALIWAIALLLALPLFIFKTVQTHDVPHQSLLQKYGLQTTTLDYCIEDWPYGNGRFHYSIFTMVFQYALPIVIVTAAYASICRKLRHRLAKTGSKLEQKLIRERRRVQRTNKLLISITVIFILSWLPLNILNIYVDYFDEWDDPIRIVFACCHMCGMSSACSNPFLYGWLNENFRKEFNEIRSVCCPRIRPRSIAARHDRVEECRLAALRPAVKTIGGIDALDRPEESHEVV